MENYAAAQKAAAKSGKPLLVEFHASWCGPCKMMEQTTFRDAAVQRLLRRFICVRVDIDRTPEVARRFGVNSIPRVLAADRNGRRTLDVVGYGPVSQFRQALESALSGRAAVQSLQEGAQPESPDVAALRRAAESGSYPAWRGRSPAVAQRARNQLVARLGAFGPAQRDTAAGLLARIGDDGVTSLVGALGHRDLAVRAAAYDALAHVLADHYRIPVASQPRFDAWAPATERARIAHTWAAWWARQRQMAGRTL